MSSCFITRLEALLSSPKCKTIFYPQFPEICFRKKPRIRGFSCELWTQLRDNFRTADKFSRKSVRRRRDSVTHNSLLRICATPSRSPLQPPTFESHPPKHKRPAKGRLCLDAEAERFELSVPCGTHAFQACALDHYATPPFIFCTLSILRDYCFFLKVPRWVFEIPLFLHRFRFRVEHFCVNNHPRSIWLCRDY